LRATQELLQFLSWQVSCLEELAAVAEVDRLAPPDRLEFARLVGQLRLVGETFQADDQQVTA
jgi:hypothetical protein